nr:hypothetical protein [Tanacetum cinerariifolium]
MSSMGSKLMVRGDECLEGCVGAGGGEVSGGGDDFRVRKSLLGEIPRVVISEGGGETFLDNGGAIISSSFFILSSSWIPYDLCCDGNDDPNMWYQEPRRPSQLRCFPFGHCHEGSDDGFQYVWYENGERVFCLETYSASVVEIARAVCFLENHDGRQHHMNVHTPLVLLRST